MPTNKVIFAHALCAERAFDRAEADGVIYQFFVAAHELLCLPMPKPDRSNLFRIDHPKEQRKKLDRAWRSGLTAAAADHFVAAHLSPRALADALAAAGRDPSKPTSLSVLVVAYHLSPELLPERARVTSASLPEGTCMVFDFLLGQASGDSRSREVRENLLALVERCGEPMRSVYSLESMDGLVSASRPSALETMGEPDLEPQTWEPGLLPFKILGISIWHVGGNHHSSWSDQNLIQ